MERLPSLTSSALPIAAALASGCGDEPVAPTTANGDAVPFEQAVKSGDVAGGDLSGTYPALSVARLQNIAVSAAAPSKGQLLAFDGQAWTPTARALTLPRRQLLAAHLGAAWQRVQ